MELAYRPAIGALRVVFAALGLRIDLVGSGRIPTTGPVILASNHVSYLDFAFVGLAARPSRRYVRFLARHDVWENAVAGPFMRGMRHIQVDRRAPAGAYLAARAALRNGEAIGIFPEAGVSKSYELRPIMPGAVALARETGAPILPMAVWGGQRVYAARPARSGNVMSLKRRRPISIAVSEAIYVDRDADVVDETRSLRCRLQTLLEAVQRAHPDQPRAGEPAPWHPARLGGNALSAEAARPLEDIPLGAIS